jgi:hypothetical protein
LSRKKAKSVAVSDPDFEAVREWYKAEFALYSFEAVRDTIELILQKKLDHRRSLEYYAMSVGLICTYRAHSQTTNQLTS